jgi:hypothetical protein
VDDFAQRRGAADFVRRNGPSFVPRPGWHHGHLIGPTRNHRSHTRQAAQTAIQADLADEHQTFEAFGGNRLVGHQHADSDGQIEPGPRLRYA